MSRPPGVLPRERALFPAAAAAAFLLLGLVAAAGSAEVREREQRTLPVELRRLNKLANAALASRATGESLPLPQFLVISAATNTAPIEITTPIPHNLAAGDEVVIRGVVGNEAANGLWKVEPRTPTSFALDGSDGSGEYAGGGSVFPTVGQPIPQGSANARGDPPWSPWYSGPAAFEPTEFFRSDGSQPTGEVSTRPLLLVDQEPVLGTSFLAQDIDGSRFRPGQPLCLSIEARIAGQPFDNQRLSILAIAAFATTFVYRADLPATLIAAEYRRFAFCFSLPAGPISDGSVLRVEFLNEARRRGPIETIDLRRPMLNEGTEPAPWTAAVEPMPRSRDFY